MAICRSDQSWRPVVPEADVELLFGMRRALLRRGRGERLRRIGERALSVESSLAPSFFSAGEATDHMLEGVLSVFCLLRQ